MKILITGSAGFIGFHLVKKLAKQEDTEIVGIDNINDYYDVNLKYARLAQSGISQTDIRANAPVKSSVYPNYTFYKTDLSDYPALQELFGKYAFDYVINMAAQAGVRYSIENPHTYIQSNIVGFTNLLECCRHHTVGHLIYASSSSVYGMNSKVPFAEDDNTDYPVSIYAATKKSDELLAHAYSHLFRVPTTGVRLFTVYGPWGRPDMAPMLFAKAIYEGKPIKVFNHGKMSRDFTYVDDIVNGITGLIPQIPHEASARPYYQLFNIGNSTPVDLLYFISTLEDNIGKKAILEMLPMQPGDVPATYANITRLAESIHYAPSCPIEKSIPVFIDWFRDWTQ